jgi:hypothetical protein
MGHSQKYIELLSAIAILIQREPKKVIPTKKNSPHAQLQPMTEE